MAYLSARDTSAKTLAFGICAIVLTVNLFIEMLQIRKAGDLSRDSF